MESKSIGDYEPARRVQTHGCPRRGVARRVITGDGMNYRWLPRKAAKKSAASSFFRSPRGKVDFVVSPYRRIPTTAGCVAIILAEDRRIGIAALANESRGCLWWYGFMAATGILAWECSESARDVSLGVGEAEK